MEFRETQSIYLQIADYVCEKILLKEWSPGGRIPSVRELAIQLEVNPNTVMRSYEFLQQEQIIFNQRGIGFFAAEDAVKQATRYRRGRCGLGSNTSSFGATPTTTIMRRASIRLREKSSSSPAGARPP